MRSRKYDISKVTINGVNIQHDLLCYGQAVVLMPDQGPQIVKLRTVRTQPVRRTRKERKAATRRAIRPPTP